MKKVIFIALLALNINASAQVTLEHTYDSASTCVSTVNGQLMIINFEISGKQYVKINRQGKLISIYNLNHSLLKNISLTDFPTNAPYGTIGDILYFSENLFNTDSKIEFMYCLNSRPLKSQFENFL
jgi:hypothetical protein